MDGIKEAHMEARISELENELKMAQEETDQLKIKIHETFKDTPVGDRIFGEAVMNPEEECQSLDEYLTKAKHYMIEEGEEKEELEEQLNDRVAIEDIADAFGEEGDAFDWESAIAELLLTKKQYESLVQVIQDTTGWGDFIQDLDDDMIQILRDGGHPEIDLGGDDEDDDDLLDK